MNETAPDEGFDTGMKKIRLEFKSRLVPHGLYGTVTDTVASDTDESRIELAVKGRTSSRSFARGQIEGCQLRVGGEVLLAIIAMVDEVSGGERGQPPGR